MKRFYLPLAVFTVFYTVWSGAALARPCDNAFDRAFVNGPIEEEKIQTKLLCKERAKKWGVASELVYVCAVSGELKEAAREYYGKTAVAAVFSDDAAADLKSTNPVVGLWFTRAGKSKENKNLIEDVLVTVNSAGTKIIRKKSNVGSGTSQFMEKINISVIEKTLRYERSQKSGSGWKPKEERVFDCEEVMPYEEPPPEKPKSITGGKPVQGNKIVNGTINAPTNKGYDPKASGISGGSK